MIDSEHELRGLLKGTFLAQAPIATVTVADTWETVFVLDVGARAREAWSLLRSCVARTERWPVLANLFANKTAPWAVQVRQADLFIRHGFSQENRNGRRGDSPDAVIEASAGLDVAAAFAGFRADDSITTEEYLEVAVQESVNRFGTAPRIDDALDFLSENRLYSFKDIERWFLDWEIATFPAALELPEAGLAHLQWYEPRESHALVLMPSDRGWEVPAYVSFYGAHQCNSQFVVALLKEWNDRYGAELVAHYGTMLQFQTTRRPQTAEEAFHLAWQQHLIAPCTTILPGVSVRDHARALLHTNQWFLHERP